MNLSLTSARPITRGAWLAVGAEAAAVVAIVAVAWALRVYRLDLAPPGLHQDEAIYGILGLYVMHGNHALFFGEREALFMYFIAAAVRLMGPDVITLRLVAAVVGTATVLLLWVVARLMYGRRVALLAAAGLAASYWHVTLSRDIFRAGTLPLLECLAFGLLWVSLRSRSRWLRLPAYALAGGALGLTLYTYIAARVVPAVVLLFFVGQILWERRGLRPAWLTLPLYLAAAALVYAPLGSLYLANPESFLGRMSEVSLAVDQASATPVGYLENLLRVAGMFFVAGDQNWRHNFDGRPVFGPFFALAFLIGLAVCLRGWRRGENRFLMLWAALMLAPTAAATDAPHYLRAIGAVPALYLLAAIGWVAAWDWVRPRLATSARPWRALAGRAAFPALVSLLLLVPAGVTGWTYFNLWLPRQETYDAYNGQLAAAGRFMAASPEWRASAQKKLDFFVSRRFWQDNPSVLWYVWQILSGQERNLADSRLGSPWFDETRALPLQPGGGHYLLADGSSWAATALARLWPGQVTRENGDAGPDGRPAVVALRAPALPPPVAAAQPLASFGGCFELVSYTLSPSVTSGGEAELVTTWRLGTPPGSWRQRDSTMTVFAHVLDADGSLLTGDNGLGYFPIDWQPGQTLLLRHVLRLPAGTAPGKYSLVLGLVGPDGKRVEESIGHGPDNTLRLEAAISVTAATEPASMPRVSQPVDWPAAGQFSLRGVDLGGEGVLAGESLRALLYWQATGDVADEYDLPLLLLDGSGKEVARDDGRPAFGRYSTSLWQAGQLVRDPRQLAVGARVRAGTYTLAVAAVNRRTAASTAPFALGTVTVSEPARTFAAPAIANLLERPASFGGEAELLGYDSDIATAKAGGQAHFTLYWRAQGESDKRYKVFVHVLSPAGKVAAQSDAEPANGSRPTSTWVQGEIVADGHTIPLPDSLSSGEYAVEIGLYDPADGSRLPLLDAAGKQVDTRLLLPAVSFGR